MFISSPHLIHCDSQRYRPVWVDMEIDHRTTSQHASFAQEFKVAALAGVAGQMLMAGQASAAQEVAAMAGDNRTGILLTLFVPAVAWVLFNIAGPALNQVNNMSDKNKAVIAGAGLGLSLIHI